MNYPEEPMTLMIPLTTPASVPEFVEEIGRIQSRIRTQLGPNQVSDFRITESPESNKPVLTCTLAPLFSFTEENKG